VRASIAAVRRTLRLSIAYFVPDELAVGELVAARPIEATVATMQAMAFHHQDLRRLRGADLMRLAPTRSMLTSSCRSR